jgi:hypothetical protein
MSLNKKVNNKNYSSMLSELKNNILERSKGRNNNNSNIKNVSSIPKNKNNNKSYSHISYITNLNRNTDGVNTNDINTLNITNIATISNQLENANKANHEYTLKHINISKINKNSNTQSNNLKKSFDCKIIFLKYI